MRLPAGVRRLLSLASTRTPARLHRDVNEELRFHLEMKVAALLDQGLDEESARAEAARQFGDIHQFEDACLVLDRQREREMRNGELLRSIAQDVRHAARLLRQSPGFTTVAVLTLALGIGATTSIFSVVSAVLLRPLPYVGADRIVFIGEQERGSMHKETTTSYPNYLDWKAEAKSFEAMALYDGWSPTIAEGGDAERIRASLVTAEIFDVFRVKPILGRPILPSDNVTNAEPVALLSHGLWRARFGGDPGVVGRVIQLNGRPRTVVGVLPPDFHPPRGELEGELWGNNWTDSTDGRGGRAVQVFARLKPDVTLEQARAEMRTIGARLATAYPETNARQEVYVEPLRDQLVGETRGPLVVLLAASALVLLIACANLSNLLLARGVSRAREMAVRAAIGATRGRTVRQLMTESAVLAAIGGAGGVLLGWWATRAMIVMAPESIRGGDVAMDGRVLAFTVVVTLLTVALFGLVPAARASRVELAIALKEGARGSVGRVGKRLRSALVVAQLALALTLLAGAGLLIKSFARVTAIESGIDPKNVLTMSMAPSSASYTMEEVTPFFDRLLERVRVIPGVRDVAVTSIVPFSGKFDRIAVTLEGKAYGGGERKPEGDRYIISSGYPRAMGLTLRSGRGFEPRDRYDAPLVALVDDVFARRTWPGESPLGKRMKLPGRDSLATVVGIVGHVKHYGLDAESGGQIYMSNRQYPWRFMSIVTRTRGAPLALAPAVRSAVREIDPNQAVFDVGSVEQWMEERLAARRFAMALLGVFAGVAVVLAAVGLYGVIAYAVTMRRGEIGVRLALGATPGEVRQMVLGDGMRLAAVGLATGVAGALMGARLIEAMLFGVSAADPAVLGAVAALMLAIAAVASWVPGRRAASVDPIAALRSE
ncbi:MAG TPA: ABC transporter permease [Gemmatimonadaceae bacterium]|nr:ABC transporter permease [Gemmatimonadaceae bacterium]